MPRLMAQIRKGGRTGTRTETGMAREGRWGAERDQERQKGRWGQTGREAGAGVNKASVGGGCVRVLGFL